MKRMLITLILIFLSVISGGTVMAADTWYKGTMHVVQWDAVTTYEDGSTIEGETVSYNLFLKNVQTGLTISIGSTPLTQFTATLSSKGRYRFGVQSALGDDVSEISWSDNAEACQDGETFGARWMNPNWPHSLRHQ